MSQCWSCIGIPHVPCSPCHILCLRDDRKSPPPEEAAEVLQDVEGRWFSFNVNKQSLIILEKKSLPQHLMEMESLEMAISLQALMVDMQDLGEAG